MYVPWLLMGPGHSSLKNGLDIFMLFDHVVAALVARGWRGFPGPSRMSSETMDEYDTVVS